jgi:hypothetical protein
MKKFFWLCLFREVRVEAAAGEARRVAESQQSRWQTNHVAKARAISKVETYDRGRFRSPS